MGLCATADAVQVQIWQKPFDFSGTQNTKTYIEALPASKPWKLCTVFPHLKDAYWLGVNYGMVQEAKRLGVELRFFEAAGYPNLTRQQELIRQCGDMPGINALIVGTVSFNQNNNLLNEIAQRIPVLATVNDISNQGITAKVGVPWYQMGWEVGNYLAKQHPLPKNFVHVAWFPGPKGAGWVPFVDKGFRDAVKNSAVKIISTQWGDTGKTIQRNLVQDTLDRFSDIDYLVGNALMAEAAISVLRERKLQKKVQLLSTYLTPGVYRGIVRGKVLAAPTDSPIIQGRLSVNQAVNVLENRPFMRHLGPTVQLLHGKNIKDLAIEGSLAPATFTPVFHFVPKK